MPSKPRRIRQLLTENSALEPLYARALRQQRILSQVRRLLPPNMARHCSAAVLNGSVLSLFTDSPVWVSKFRFQAPQLLSELRAEHPGIANIAVRCETPQKSLSAREKLPAARRSDPGSAAVSATAANISDAPLRSALLRLAKRLRE